MAGFKTFVDLDILTAAEVNDFLMTQAVMVFADAAARTTALPTPSEGMVTYLEDSNVLEKYLGASWVDITADSIAKALVDAKGDIITATADNTPARLAVGTNEHRLVADSATSTGLAYVADTTNYAIAAKGDLLAGTAADTLAALTVGTNGQVLTADSSTATGLAWGAAAGGGDFVHIASATPSAVSSVSFDNVFTSTYVNYRIVATLTDGANTVNMRLRVSSSDNSSTNYHEQLASAADSTVATVRQQSQQQFAVSSPNSSRPTTFDILITRPQQAATTQMIRTGVDVLNGATEPRYVFAGYTFNAATQFDGFTLFSSNAFTGRVDVYGLGI
jgi:hypothetical protein